MCSPFDNINFGPGPASTGVVAGAPFAARVAVARYPARAWAAAGLLTKRTTAAVAATARSPSNVIYSIPELPEPSPLNPPVKMLLVPVLPTFPLLAICALLVVYMDTYGATVTVVLALTLPALFEADSV